MTSHKYLIGPSEMSKDEALNLLREALDRIENPTKNHNGGDWKVGGCYWRLMRVLVDFVVPQLDKENEHMFDLIHIHGLPLEFSALPAEMRDEIIAAQRTMLDALLHSD